MPRLLVQLQMGSTHKHRQPQDPLSCRGCGPRLRGADDSELREILKRACLTTYFNSTSNAARSESPELHCKIPLCPLKRQRSMIFRNSRDDLLLWNESLIYSLEVPSRRICSNAKEFVLFRN